MLEAQLEGLAHSADDTLGKTVTALQDVASWGGHSVSVPVALQHSPAPGPRPWAPTQLTSLVDGVLGNIGHIVSHVLEKWTVFSSPGGRGPSRRQGLGRLQGHSPSYRVTTRSKGNGLHMMAGNDL